MKISFELEENEEFTSLRDAEALEKELIGSNCEEVIDFLALIIKHKEQKYERFNQQTGSN